MITIKTVGSVCSGIEAASVAWKPLGVDFEWFSEIADFPSKVLSEHYPNVSNVGDMNNIPTLITSKAISAPDLICGGTPCQAFSLAGWKNGLNDNRGNLTLKFVDIVEANDSIRKQNGLTPSIVFWENVEGVLTDKTNAFGCLVSSLAGLDDVLSVGKRWPTAGLIRGKKRNVAWRVLDAKYFGLPQQRKRVYLLAGGLDFKPEEVLFEAGSWEAQTTFPKTCLRFEKEGHKFEVFREYSDCLYSSYGTKWNGNAAAYNGSLFVVQDGQLRRLSPVECERLMGFPDGYTNLLCARKTNRYQATGNSWAVPVVKWIGKRIMSKSDYPSFASGLSAHSNDGIYFDLSEGIINCSDNNTINCSPCPNSPVFRDISEIISPCDDESIYISPVGCYGILRRTIERNVGINPRLKEVLTEISSKMSYEDIDKKSRVQHRGKLSN